MARAGDKPSIQRCKAGLKRYTGCTASSSVHTRNLSTTCRALRFLTACAGSGNSAPLRSHCLVSRSNVETSCRVIERSFHTESGSSVRHRVLRAQSTSADLNQRTSTSSILSPCLASKMRCAPSSVAVPLAEKQHPICSIPGSPDRQPQPISNQSHTSCKYSYGRQFRLTGFQSEKDETMAETFAREVEAASRKHS